MRCPFLREAQVKSCMASDVRKMIVRLPDRTATERCTSPGYENCPALKQYHTDTADNSRCPFLQESLVQYCAAAPVVKYIPWSESSLSRCCTEHHKYCDLYAAMAGRRGDTEGGEHPVATGSSPRVRLPEKLWYSKNHMWLDIGRERGVHVGVDAFFAGLFEAIEAITFVTRRGHCRPEVTFTSEGTELTMTFPHAMMITDVNNYLRTNPSRILSDPYRAGWLFEGLDMQDSCAPARTPMADGLIPGTAAGEWLVTESERMTGFVHDLLHEREGAATMADGGHYQEKLFPLLDAHQRRSLYDRFFRSPVGRRVSP
jgi:glycine cleavage system H lipoate-binding protein